MNFHPGSSEGKLRPNFNCCYLQYQRASRGLLDLWGGECFSWVTSRQGPLSGQVCFFSMLVLTMQQTLITASLSPAVIPVPRSAREPTVRTSCLSLQGLKKTSEEPALRFTSHRHTAASARPTERWFKYTFTLRISPSFAHGIGMCCTICFSEEEPGSNSSSLCVLSRARGRGEWDPWWAGE